MKPTFFQKYRTEIVAVCLIIALFALAWLLFAGIQTVKENKSLTLRYTEEVTRASEKYGVEEARIYAVIKVESDFDRNAESSHGARGLMQMLPSTFEEQCALRGENSDPARLFEPDVNVDYCTEYLKILYDMTGDWRWAHIAYFAGIGNVLKWKEQGLAPDALPMDSAATYLQRINDAYEAYRELLKPKE